jgi:ABC-type branched-subunit amino acid transport system permease subunit
MMARPARYLGLASALVVGAVALFFMQRLNTYYLGVINLTLVNAIAAIGLVLLSGVAGQISLGTAGLVAVGAYSTGMLMVHLGVAFLPAAIGGAVVTTLIGTALAAPALRLSGLHLAIVTLAFGIIIVQFIGMGGKLTGGMSGLFVPAPSILGWEVNTEYRKLLLVLVPFLVVTFASANFVRLKPGRALHILRDREMIARAMGVNTSAYKILTFAYSAFLCGISGALLGALKGYISVDDFTLWTSLYFFVMIVIGGITSIVGAIIGAAVVTLLPELLRSLQEYAQAALGVITLLIFLFARGGVVGLAQRTFAAIAGRGASAPAPGGSADR